MALFQQFLSSADIDVTDHGVFCQEPSKSVRKLESSLRLNSNRLDEFIDGLEAYLSTSLEQSLQSTCVRGLNSSSLPAPARFGHFGIGAGDSLLKLLLRVQPIQARVDVTCPHPSLHPPHHIYPTIYPI
jgi:hypothetical protein